MLNEHDLKEHLEEMERKLEEAYRSKESIFHRQLRWLRDLFLAMGLK